MIPFTQDLLSDASYNVERAANNYFEGNYRKKTVEAPRPAVEVQRHRVEKMSTHPKDPQWWLIGRRVVLGYTLSGGNAFRSQGLSFKLEGVADGKRVASLPPRRTQKFTGANLLFQCYNSPIVSKNVHLSGLQCVLPTYSLCVLGRLQMASLAASPTPCAGTPPPPPAVPYSTDPIDFIPLSLFFLTHSLTHSPYPPPPRCVAIVAVSSYPSSRRDSFKCKDMLLMTSVRHLQDPRVVID